MNHPIGSPEHRSMLLAGIRFDIAMARLGFLTRRSEERVRGRVIQFVRICVWKCSHPECCGHPTSEPGNALACSRV